MGRKTLTVSESTFEEMKKHREDGESWDEYHRRMLREQELYSKIDELVNNIPERTADMIQERRRGGGGGSF